MRCSHKLARRLAIESLAERLLLAGDVAAYLGLDRFGSETVLVVEGDNLANDIRIIDDVPGHARIEGLNGTTVNGKTADDVFAAHQGWGGPAEIDLGNGDDVLTYEFTDDSEHFHTSFIETGNGHDRVTLLVQEGASAFISTGTGNDVVSVQAQGVVRGLFIDTGVGSDEVTLNLAANAWFTPGPLSFEINTGTGDDFVLIHADSDGGFPDLGEFAVVDTETGNDVVQFEGVFHIGGELTVLLGNGDDTLIGDEDSTLPRVQVQCVGGLGHDTVLNASYFVSHSALHFFETIED